MPERRSRSPPPLLTQDYKAFGTAPRDPLPACGERVGVRGPFHRLRLAERPPHPDSPRKRGEEEAAP